MIKVRPKDWNAAKAGLVPGTAVATPYEAKMTADSFAGCA
jgi:glycine cleavage system H protein